MTTNPWRHDCTLNIRELYGETVCPVCDYMKTSEDDETTDYNRREIAIYDAEVARGRKEGQKRL